MRCFGLIGALLTTVLSGCAMLPEPSARGCVSATTEIAGGSHFAELDVGCERVALTVRPEVEPINPSPWYALELVTESSRGVQLEINYAGYSHRYHPWINGPNAEWRRLTQDRVTTTNGGELVQLDLLLEAGRTIVAAQPILAQVEHAAWMEHWRDLNPALHQEVIGSSVQGRPLVALGSVAPDPDLTRPLVVILGRQHPPEVTGGFAMKGFVEALLEAAMARPLPFDYVIVPVINPDGVEHGFWRTNANGVDLNRDWQNQTQPETLAVWQFLERNGLTLRSEVIMVDFHSTLSDRIYRDAYEAEDWRDRRIEAWLSRLATGERAPDVRVTRSAGGQTAKSVFDSIGALAITWEAGDATSPQRSEQDGRVGFDALLATWTCTTH